MWSILVYDKYFQYSANHMIWVGVEEKNVKSEVSDVKFSDGCIERTDFILNLWWSYFLRKEEIIYKLR